MPTREKVPNIKREGWSIQKVAEEATNEQPDEILRKTLRGQEKNGNSEKSDIAGVIDSKETPQGSEENKKKTGAKNKNG